MNLRDRIFSARGQYFFYIWGPFILIGLYIISARTVFFTADPNFKSSRRKSSRRINGWITCCISTVMWHNLYQRRHRCETVYRCCFLLFSYIVENRSFPYSVNDATSRRYIETGALSAAYDVAVQWSCVTSQVKMIFLILYP